LNKEHLVTEAAAMHGYSTVFVANNIPGEPFEQEQRRKTWLDDKRSNLTAEAHHSRAMCPGKFGRAAEANQRRSAAKAGFSKMHNFDRPLSKPHVDQLVTPWRATVRKGDLQQNVDGGFWERSTAVGAARQVGSKYSLSKVEAQAALQRQITSGIKIDWNEVRNLRKTIAEAD